MYALKRNAGGIKAFREMGYEGFEFALNDCATLKERCGSDPAEVKAALKAYDIQAIGSHISWESLLENPDPVLNDCLLYDVPYAAIALYFMVTERRWMFRKNV